MPFYTIDWARYVNHADSRGAVDASSTINDVMRILMKVWKYSGHWLGYKLPKKYRWACLIHKILLLLLVLCTLTAASLSFRFWTPWIFDAALVQRVTLTLVYWQCAGSTAAFFFWQVRQRFKGFAKLLNAATMGIGKLLRLRIWACVIIDIVSGLMREKQRLSRLQYVVLIGFGLWALVISSYHAIGMYLPTDIAVVPYPWRSIFWMEKLQPLSLLLVIYAAFNWFVAHVLLADYYAFLTAEIHSLNADLRADSNLYQVAVLKHYSLIYHRLTHVNRHLNSAFGPLLTLTTATCYSMVIMNSILFYTRYYELDRTDVIFGLVTASMAGLYLIAFSAAALVLRRKVRKWGMGKFYCDLADGLLGRILLRCDPRCGRYGLESGWRGKCSIELGTPTGFMSRILVSVLSSGCLPCRIW